MLLGFGMTCRLTNSRRRVALSTEDFGSRTKLPLQQVPHDRLGVEYAHQRVRLAKRRDVVLFNPMTNHPSLILKVVHYPLLMPTGTPIQLHERASHLSASLGPWLLGFQCRNARAVTEMAEDFKKILKLGRKDGTRALNRSQKTADLWNSCRTSTASILSTSP